MTASSERRLEKRIFLNQLAHPIDEDAHLRGQVTALRIHHRYRQLLRRPVGEHLREVPRFQVWPRHVVRDLHDPKTHDTGYDIGIVIVHRKDAIECELGLPPISNELPVEDSSRAI